MAIQNRRGNYSDFDPTKMKPGEFAVVQNGDPDADDGEAVYIAFEAGKVKRLSTHDEVVRYDNDAKEAAQTASNASTRAQEAAELTTRTKNETIQLVEDIPPYLERAKESALTEISNAETSSLNDINRLNNETVQSLTELKEDAIQEITNTYNSHVDDINAKAAQIAAIKTSAENTAAQAVSTASEANAVANETRNFLDNIDERMKSVEFASENFVDDGFVENGVAYFTNNGQVLFEITGIGGGGGGGGGDTTNAKLTVTNTTGWLSKTVASGAELEVTLLWTSIEDDMPTGNGTVRITNNGVIKTSYEVAQGNISIDVSDYLVTGANVIKVQISDIYGQSRTINFSINVVALSISSTFDTSNPFDSTILFPYTPTGAVNKTVYFILDGNQFATYDTSVSNRQLTQTIPAQSHGAHSLRVYFTAEINGELVKSNELYYEFIALETLNNTPIIISPFNTTTVSQYSIVNIPATVYDPVNATTEITLSVNGEETSKQTVDRSEHSYSVRANNVGTLRFTITCRGVSKTFTMTVTETDIDVEPETENLALYLTSEGRSNSADDRDEWKYNDITTTFTGNNYVTDGWIADDDGNIARRFSGDARGTINFKLFERDFRTTGKTITFEFAARNVLNYDSTIISCMSDGIGLSITPQMARLSSEQSSISTQYKEDEHIRLDWVIEKRSENRLGLMYINGIICGAIQYPDDDDFSQSTPVNISLGSSDCVLDLYCVRVYDNDLTKVQVLNNWIADTLDGTEMLDRYTRNNIYDAYGNIVISQLPKDLPYLIIECAELPQYKGDKKTCSGRYVDPVYPSRSFTFTDAQFDVQGTSSQYYPRKNYKTKYKNGIVLSNGTVSDTYAINNDAIPTNTFTYKKDFASSEGANNVELVRAYNDICPYKTPGQKANSKVRQGIDGFPIVIFWRDTTTDTVTFVGKYNFNNDKGTPEVFGFYNDDESWEIKNNSGNRVIWKDNNYAGTAWLNDFEARYPDTDPVYTDATQLQEFATWAMTTDTTTATGNTLPSPVTYTVTTTEIVEIVDPNTGAISYEEVEVTKDVTFTNDTAEYRLAKFKDEAGDYMEMDSALFYYLFTELFLMVDNRAKNAFPSFMGSEVTA